MTEEKVLTKRIKDNEIKITDKGMNAEFETRFKIWVKSACEEWKFPEPSQEYYSKIVNRLPYGLQSLLIQGIKDGLIILEGKNFFIQSKTNKKGPYNWFSKFSSKKEPAPNWEWFVHAAEFVRFSNIAKTNNLTVVFEDDLMDIALYKDKKLVICCEVKEKSDKLKELIKGIKTYQNDIDFIISDRGNDSLRKAKYIIKRRPEYFCGVAIGIHFEFKVTYPSIDSFKLTEDIIPWV
ncbi:MAG: hypothetical protein KAU20_07065 [Nanoarchaeota archaeon]|nr:hypothetical protein [Nanoarchaeota archaeon]